jgi:threonine dehydrogenase-like Zn-dependent dehydrogenase
VKVCVIGCGPSGLLAAHACRQAGHKLTIISSDGAKSVMAGAMYVHEAIPGITAMNPDAHLLIEKRGTPEGYAIKVYGDATHPVSWNQFSTGYHDIWYMDKTYDKLWNKYKRYGKVFDVTPQAMDEIIRHFDLVIATLPKPAVCYREHEFNSVPIWVSQRRLMRDVVYADTMVYSGLAEDPWYRRSMINNIVSIEYPQPPIGREHTTGIKPTSNDCNCWPRVLWAGRWGRWEKGVLVHHVYRQVKDALQSL